MPVCRLGYGAMGLTGPGIWGPPKDRQVAHRVLRRAVELGVNFIDTADSYGPAVSEEIIAEALHPYPSGVVVATKAGYERHGPHASRPNGHPTHLRTSCEASLMRLKVDRVDLFQLHCVDPKVPMEESLGALVKLQQEGKIRHIGISNVSLEQLLRACALARIVSVQNQFSRLNQSSADVLAECEKRDLPFIPWYPLASGKAAEGRLARLGAGPGRVGLATPAQLSIAWLLKRPPVMLPIPGTSSPQHLEENVTAASLGMSSEQIESALRWAASVGRAD
jgi:aryl-alcohol dehydrogenase-like predicted oxidoreductase